ncbi:hypothetical protein ACNHKD_00735 [Methylocystis sp. JAN1]|uniref:hypothetical protein n=1 Tax=Methylocystis sp. JAN1 TaxID=3397211 RepID=UPI003FA280AC
MVIEISIARAGKPIFRRTFDTAGPASIEEFRVDFYQSFARNYPKLSLDDPKISQTWTPLRSTSVMDIPEVSVAPRLRLEDRRRKQASG